MLVRVQSTPPSSRSSVEERRFSTPGPRGFESCREPHGPVAQRMSAEILTRRTRVQFLSGSPMRSVNRAGPGAACYAVGAFGHESRNLGAPPSLRAWRTGVRAWLPTRRCEFDSHCPHQLCSLPLAARRADLQSDNTGSSPVGSTNMGEWRSGSATHFECEGRWFDPILACQFAMPT